MFVSFASGRKGQGAGGRCGGRGGEIDITKGGESERLSSSIGDGGDFSVSGLLRDEDRGG